MKPDKRAMEITRRMSELRHLRNQELQDGQITVEFFHPYTRQTWQFRVNGEAVARRYTPETAAALFQELSQRHHEPKPDKGDSEA